MDEVCIDLALYSAFSIAVGCCFSSLAEVLKCSGVLFTTNCNLPCEEKEFIQLPFSNSLLDGYHHALSNQTTFGMCSQTWYPVSTLCNFMVWISGLDSGNGLCNIE